jgi:hypothetical protein
LQAFVFTSLQNATQTTIGSWGTSETDNTPFRLYQASGSTLQWYGNGGYQQLGYSEIGKQQVIVERYIDYPPYTTTVFLDGVAVYSIDSYVYDVASKRIYIGSGYPTQYDGIIHQHLFIQGVIWTDAEIAEYSARPWSSLREATRRPFIFFGPPAGGTGTDAAIAGTQESDVGAITAEATTGAALAGTQASDVGAVTVEATTGAAIAGTQDSDVAALVVDSEVGTTSCAIGGVQASDVGAIAVEATLGLELAGTQASNLGYIVVEATLPAAIAGTQASDVAAVTVTAASSSIWTDIPAASTIWTDL